MVTQNELLRDELAIAFGHILGHELTPHKERFETTLDVVYAFNLHYADIILTLDVTDSEGEEVASPTIVLKTGAVIGSGDIVSADVSGQYVVQMGSYNYSIAKTGYETQTGTIKVEYQDAETEEKRIPVILHKPCVVTIAPVDESEEAVDGTTIIVKTGEEIGSGTTVTAEVDGTYQLGIGTYNYSVAKDAYVTETGTFEIQSLDLDDTKTVTVVLTVDAE